VHLVEVDVVGAEAAQRPLHRPLDVETVDGRQPVADRRHEPPRRRPGDLTGEDDALARLRLEPPPDDLLGLPRQVRARRHRVEFGGIEKVHSRRVRLVHHRKSRLLVALPRKRHRPEGDRADAQAAAADVAILHCFSFLK